MKFKDIIQNTWSEEELFLLEENKDKTNKELYEIFKKIGFNRSEDAIRRKRNKYLKDKFDSVAKSNSKELLKLTEEIDIDKIKIKTPTFLLIPDPHVTNEQDLGRFDALSKLISDRKPDVIIIGGDLADMLSLSAWEKSNKLSVEGRRYKLEIEAVNEALDKLLSFKKRNPLYTPRIIYLFGNHEFRVERYVEANPNLAGHMDLVIDLKLEKRNIEVVPYKKFIELEGVLFTHAPLNAAGLAISGKACVHKAAEITSKSMVFFHTHQTQEYSCLRHGDNDLIQIYTAGCLFPGHAPGGYADDSPHASTKCISFLHMYRPGRFDIEQISLERLER